jgi:hypothetical protein
MTDLMEQKLSTAVAISERLIHTAYSNRLAPEALHHEALPEIVKYINEIAQNSDLLSFIHHRQTCSWWKLHTFTNLTKKHLFWSSMFLWSLHTTSCPCMSSGHFRSTSTFAGMFRLHQRLGQPT